MLINYKLIISYRGDSFLGYQRQKVGRTVEGDLLVVIRTIFNEAISIVGAGRTDSGVHALGQVVNFKSNKRFNLKRLKYALNSLLTDSISILNIEIVNNDFNARKSATSRVYHYLFSPFILPTFIKDVVSYVNFDSSVEYMNQCSQVFLGEHDFSRFRKLGSNEKSSIRDVKMIKIEKKFILHPYGIMDGIYYYSLQIEANSFLYRMVRNCVGALFQIFQECNTMDELSKMVNFQDIGYKYSAAPSKGLCLVKVNY